jgi:hypothetical protein
MDKEDNTMTDISNTQKQIQRSTFINMLMRYWAYRKNKGVEPKIIYITPGGPDYINLTRFNDMRHRYETWEATYGSPPNYVNVIGSIVTTPPKVLTGDAGVLQNLRDRFGTLNSLQDLCGIIQDHGSYSYYYDQQQSQQTTLNTMRANCADWVNDIGMPVARALGYTPRGVHCQVRCDDGNWYGHYVMEINGDLYDPAGWSKTHPINELICNNGYQFLHFEGDNIP